VVGRLPEAAAVSAVTVRGLDGAVRALREAGERIQALVPQAMRRAAGIVEREAKRLSPMDTGRLMSSITSETRGIGMEVVGIVGSNVEYAPYVELGTKPHFPPVSALEVWARRHGTTAFVVARAIARRGTRARRFLQGAFEAKKNEVISLFVRLVEEIRV